MNPAPTKFPIHLDDFILIHTRIWWAKWPMWKLTLGHHCKLALGLHASWPTTAFSPPSKMGMHFYLPRIVTTNKDLIRIRRPPLIYAASPHEIMQQLGTQTQGTNFSAMQCGPLGTLARGSIWSGWIWCGNPWLATTTISYNGTYRLEWPAAHVTQA